MTITAPTYTPSAATQTPTRPSHAGPAAHGPADARPESAHAPARERGFGRHRRRHSPDAYNARLMGIQAASPNADGDVPGVRSVHVAPPAPPMKLTPAVACDPQTDEEVLWYIAHNAPELRRWLVANPQSTPELLEFVAQAGGPGVNEAIEVLLDLIERFGRR